MEHNRRPRNFRRLDGPSHTADGFNPFCGDQITLDVEIEDGVIKDIGFEGSGCAISRASASLMTETIRDRSEGEAQDLFEAFRRMITRAPDDQVEDEDLGDLAVLSGVSEFPVRIKCATLSWHTLNAALNGQENTVSTEEART